MAAFGRFVQDFGIARPRDSLAAIEAMAGPNTTACPMTMQLADDAAPLRRCRFGPVAHAASTIARTATDTHLGSDPIAMQQILVYRDLLG
jgi:hypothetical protein